MWKINRLNWLGIWFFISTLLFPTMVFAQQPVAWESSLENAQRLAAQTNRLVLIHFWAPWCNACKKMDAEVFNQPGVGAALQASYVPVRINADQMPDTAKQYAITALPTQVVLTPQAQIVDVMRGRTEATQFVAHLNQVATASKNQLAGQTTQVPVNIPAPTTDRTATQPFPANNQPAGKPALSDNRYADYFHRNQMDPSALSAAAPQQTPQTMLPNPAIASSSSAQPQTSSGPELNAPGRVQAPVNSAPPAFGTSPSPAPNVPLQMASISNQSMQAPIVNAPQQAPPTSNQSLPPAAGNPPLCLDGFCPVSLTEKQQWLAGDRRFGAIHRGRTYLFTGADEQRRFFADPDRYAPVIAGNDVVLAIERGQTVPGTREHGVFFNNHIFLFVDEAALEKFSRNPAYYASQALEAIRTSAHPVQQFR